MRRTVRRAPVAVTSFIAGVGLLIQAIGYARGWQAQSGTVWLFLLGLATLIAPYCFLLPARSITLRQRLWGCVSIGITMYLSFLLDSPLLATRFDETLHVTTMVDLLGQRGFFSPHTFLPVSPYYPGLELAASGVHWLTGMPLMACQVTVVVFARLVTVLGLFGIATRLCRSEQAGAIAVLLYAGCSQFWMFNSMFAYQTIALALGIAVVRLLIAAVDARDRWPAAPLIAAGIAMCGCVVSHHITSWITLLALWAWGAVAFVAGRGRVARIVLSSAALFTAVAAGWTMLVWRLISVYLLPQVDSFGSEMVQMLHGHTERSVTGAQGGAPPTPDWQLAFMFAAMALWCVVLAPAGWQVLRGNMMSHSWTRWVLLVTAGMFPVAFLTRFMPKVAEIADRGSAFTGIAAAILGAGWLVYYSIRRWPRIVVATALGVLVMGGVMLGSGADWQRVTGPYLPGAEQRSIDHVTVSVARWTQEYIPPGSRIAADATLSRFLPNYADVFPDTSIGGGHNVGPLFYHATLTPEDRRNLIADRVDFVYVDTRMAQHAAYTTYFEGGDPTAPVKLTAAELDKFDSLPGFDMVLDGPIRVYDVRNLRLVPRTFVDNPTTLVPGTSDRRRMAAAAAVLVVLGAAVILRRRHSGAALIEELAGGGFGAAVSAGPLMMAIGAVGVGLGFDPDVGLAVLGLVALAALVALHPWTGRRRQAVPAAATGPGVRAVRAAVVVLYLAAIGIAVYGEWQGLFEATTTLPAPSWSGP